MVLASIVLPGMLAVRTADLMRGLFLCFALAAILNVFFVFDNPSSLVERLKGYPGYFTGKNLLGEFAAITFLLSLHEVFYPGLRRALGIIMIITSTLLLLWSNSRTSHGLALVVPFLAALTLLVAKRMRISPAIILLAIPICYAALSGMYPRFNMYRVSYALFGDATFSGRSIIWEFALKEIELRPLLGWGYQSFWLVGPDAPSIVDAPGFIKTMPNAHNGYYDTMLELGYVGLAFLLVFLISTLHVIGRVAERDNKRAWLLLSVALFIVIYNLLETLWLRAFDMSWVVFVIVAVDAARYWQASMQKEPAHRPAPAGMVSRGPARGAWRPRLGARS